VEKFFDSVDQEVLLGILSRCIKDSISFGLLKEVICSFTSVHNESVGMPIGNLTSQIFANIYLHELDRFVTHHLKPKSYLRYGDDFILVDPDLDKLKFFRVQIIDFLENELKLKLNGGGGMILNVFQGLKFLGVKIWPNGRKLTKRNLERIDSRLGNASLSSYYGLMKKHRSEKHIKIFHWMVCEKGLLD